MSEGLIALEIRKRPFIRPLLFWIVGILLQVCFPLQTISFCIPLAVAALLVFSLFFSTASVSYSYRWVWGAIFAALTVFFAIQMTALAEIRLSVPQEEGFLLRKAREMQASMVERLAILRLPDADKSVLATITVNFRRAMTWELRSKFSVAGVSHLLAVSGFHVGIVCAFTNALFSLLPKHHPAFRWVKYLAMMFFLWAFAFISGLSAASVRAAVMLTIYLTANVLRRNQEKYNTLACAAFLMLVYNPFYLFDVGFQLSFFAVFSILYLQPRLTNLIEVRNPLISVLWNTLTISVAAQVGTIPLCFFYFGQSSAVFLFSNLFLSLIATVLIPVALAWMLLPLWFPGLDLLQSLIETLTRWMMWIVDGFSSVPGATFSLKFDFVTMMFAYVCLCLGLLYMRARRFWMLLAALLAFLGTLCWQFFR